MTLRIDTSSLSGEGRKPTIAITTTKTKKAKFIEFPKTLETEHATETKDKKSLKNTISDDELLDMSPEDWLKNLRKTCRESAEKEWKENIKNAKTPEEKAKQKEIYDSRMNYKKAVIEFYRRSPEGYTEEKLIEVLKKLQEVKNNVRADNGMTMKEASDTINAIYSKYRRQYSKLGQIEIEQPYFEPNPDGRGGHLRFRKPEEIEEAYGMSAADKAKIQEARAAIAQIKEIFSLYRL